MLYPSNECNTICQLYLNLEKNLLTKKINCFNKHEWKGDAHKGSPLNFGAIPFLLCGMSCGWNPSAFIPTSSLECL